MGQGIFPSLQPKGLQGGEEALPLGKAFARILPRT